MNSPIEQEIKKATKTSIDELEKLNGILSRIKHNDLENKINEIKNKLYDKLSEVGIPVYRETYSLFPYHSAEDKATKHEKQIRIDITISKLTELERFYLKVLNKLDR